MATAPTVPNFSQYNFDLGDTDEAITKQNGQNAALVSYGNSLAQFGAQIEQEQAETISAANQIKQDTFSARDEAVSAKNAAQDAVNDAEEIVYGDALGDLQTILDEINGVSV